MPVRGTHPERRVRVALVCPGLGHIQRGFETFTRECFEVLSSDPRLDVWLFKGADRAYDREQVVWCVKRTAWLAQALAGFRLDIYERYGPYYVEQTTFTVALIPRLMLLRPDVVLFSDSTVGHLLWRWKRLTSARFKLLLSNGGPIGPPRFPRFDHVHQVSSFYFDAAVSEGRPSETQTLVPYGFRFASMVTPPSDVQRRSIRTRLGMPIERPIVLSVGALNASHKRMDYLVREIFSLRAPRPYLVMLGSQDSESPSLLAAASESLGTSGFHAATVNANIVQDYYVAADVFALASMNEGFGRVYVEALGHGLPCVVHDGPVQREVCGDVAAYVDASLPGAFGQAIDQILAMPENRAARIARQRSVYERFSWDRLLPRYVEMVLKAANGPSGTV